MRLNGYGIKGGMNENSVHTKCTLQRALQSALQSSSGPASSMLLSPKSGAVPSRCKSELSYFVDPKIKKYLIHSSFI